MVMLKKIKILFFSFLLFLQFYVVSNPGKTAAPYIKDWKITASNDGKIEFDITTQMGPGTENDLVQITHVDIMGLLSADKTTPVKGIVNCSGVVEKFTHKLVENLDSYEKKILIGALIAGCAWFGCDWGTKIMACKDKDSEAPVHRLSRLTINRLRKYARFCAHLFFCLAGVSYFLRKKIIPNISPSLTKIVLESVLQ